MGQRRERGRTPVGVDDWPGRRCLDGESRPRLILPGARGGEGVVRHRGPAVCRRDARRPGPERTAGDRGTTPAGCRRRDGRSRRGGAVHSHSLPPTACRPPDAVDVARPAREQIWTEQARTRTGRTGPVGLPRSRATHERPATPRALSSSRGRRPSFVSGAGRAPARQPLPYPRLPPGPPSPSPPRRRGPRSTTATRCSGGTRPPRPALRSRGSRQCTARRPGRPRC